MRAILLIVFMILNFVVYHKVFRVTYFGSMRKSIANELIWCLLGACVEVAIVIMIGQLIGRILFFAGLAALIIFWLILVYRYWNKIKNRKMIRDDVSQNEEAVSESICDNNEKVEAESFIDRCATLDNILWIGALWLVIVLFLSGAASPGEKENEEIQPDKNYVEELEEPETEPFAVEDTVQEVDYESIYAEVIAEIQSDVLSRGGSVEYLTYALYDMDKDGYKELIAENSTCSADAIYEVYTTDGKTISMLGEIVGNCGFYEVQNGYGLYADYGKGGYEYINHVYSEGNSLIEQMIFEQETEDYGYYKGEPIEELKYPIEMYYITEFESLYAGVQEAADSVLEETRYPKEERRIFTESEINPDNWKDVVDLRLFVNGLYEKEGQQEINAEIIYSSNTAYPTENIVIYNGNGKGHSAGNPVLVQGEFRQVDYGVYGIVHYETNTVLICAMEKNSFYVDVIQTGAEDVKDLDGRYTFLAEEGYEKMPEGTEKPYEHAEDTPPPAEMLYQPVADVGVSDEYTEAVKDICGIYEGDNGVDVRLRGEVGIYSDNGEGYVNLNAEIYEEDCPEFVISEYHFLGDLVWLEGNTFCSTGEDGAPILIITFSRDGMAIETDLYYYMDDDCYEGFWEKQV